MFDPIAFTFFFLLFLLYTLIVLVPVYMIIPMFMDYVSLPFLSLVLAIRREKTVLVGLTFLTLYFPFLLHIQGCQLSD